MSSVATRPGKVASDRAAPAPFRLPGMAGLWESKRIRALPDLSSHAKVVATALAEDCPLEVMCCWHSDAAIAERTGLSRYKVRRALAELERYGLASRVFKFEAAALEQLVAAGFVRHWEEQGRAQPRRLIVFLWRLPRAHDDPDPARHFVEEKPRRRAGKHGARADFKHGAGATSKLAPAPTPNMAPAPTESHKEESRKGRESVPSPVPPPSTSAAPPATSPEDGTGRVAPPISEPKLPDPELVARLEAQAKLRGSEGLKARLLLAGLREDARPPEPETPVQSPPPPPLAVKPVPVASPGLPAREGRFPVPRVRPDEKVPLSELERAIRALDGSEAAAQACARRMARRYREGGNDRTVATFARGLLSLPTDLFIGRLREIERDCRAPNHALAKWIAREVPGGGSVAKLTPPPGH